MQFSNGGLTFVFGGKASLRCQDFGGCQKPSIEALANSICPASPQGQGLSERFYKSTSSGTYSRRLRSEVHYHFWTFKSLGDERRLAFYMRGRGHGKLQEEILKRTFESHPSIFCSRVPRNEFIKRRSSRLSGGIDETRSN